MKFNRQMSRRTFHELTLAGFASAVGTVLTSGCGGQTGKATTSNRAQPTKKYGVYDDQRVKQAHDTAGATVARLRKLPSSAERGRHLFNMIRTSEYAWAGRLTDLDRANREIDQADRYCRQGKTR